MPEANKGRSSERRPHSAPMAQINIIPLVDVMLVLLIIFMATAAFVKDSELGLKLPRAASGTAARENNGELTIALTRAGVLLADGKAIEETQLAPLMRARLKADPQVKVSIKGDGGVPYERVVKIMDTARQAGLTSVALGTREPDGR